MIDMRKLQSPLGEKDQITIKEYKDSNKTFWKIVYHSYLLNSGIEREKKKKTKKIISKKQYNSICKVIGQQITLDNLDSIIENYEDGFIKCFGFCVDKDSYSKEQIKDYLIDLKEKAEKEKDYANVRRARDKIFEYAACNDFDYFVTLTLDKDKTPYREDLSRVYPIISQWFRDYKKKNKDFAYIILPEEHKKGGWHFHCLIKGINKDDLIPFSKEHQGSKYINKKISEGQVVLDWIPWFKRWGFNDVEPIKNKEAVERYITKYCTKSLGASVKEINAQMYYCSKGLKTAETIAKGTYSGKIDAHDAEFFDYVGDYCSVKIVKDKAELENLKELLIQKNLVYIDNMIIDKDTGEILS